ncbi:MAG: hypothetical protein IKD06_02765 [Clostridia bacterium]|nr:hypothetical protein [Clostridia bacterium]
MSRIQFKAFFDRQRGAERAAKGIEAFGGRARTEAILGNADPTYAPAFPMAGVSFPIAGWPAPEGGIPTAEGVLCWQPDGVTPLQGAEGAVMGYLLTATLDDSHYGAALDTVRAFGGKIYS